MNSVLWGGTYNALIPTYKKLPNNWAKEAIESITAAELANGYLNAFDPDFVSCVGKYRKPPIDANHRELISANKIISGIRDDGSAPYGIGIYDLLRHLYEENFRFVSRRPAKLIFVSAKGEHELFIASVFGSIPKKLRGVIRRNFAPHFDGEFIEMALDDYTDYLSPEYIFPRRLASIGVKTRNRRGERNDTVFLMDATKPSDIIDYWNLRAAGHFVYPVPVQLARHSKTLSAVAKVIEQSYFPFRSNPDIYNSSTIQKSRAVSKSALSDFAKSLPVSAPESGRPPKYVLQEWPSRLWSAWARSNAEGSVADIYSDEDTHDISFDHTESSKVPCLKPSVISESSYTGLPEFANTVSVSTFGAEEPTAEVIPEGGASLVRAIGHFDSRSWRASSRGPVRLLTGDRSIYLSLPRAEPVLIEWLKERGWSAELSPSGKIAKQMYKRLSKSIGARILQSKGIVRLIETINRRNIMTHEQLTAALQRISNEENSYVDVERYLKNLLDSDILQLGIKIRCDHCQKNAWFDLDSLTYRVNCTSCLEPIEVGSETPNQSKWAYRTIGPFSLPNRSYGAITVVLAEAYFSHNRLSISKTSLFSFEAKRGGKMLEADLAVLYRSSRRSEMSTEIVFFECKTNNHFEKKDVDRMKELGNEFPNAILVFATLNDELNDKEKRLIRPLVNRERRNWRARRAYNPILVLTGVELLSSWGAPQCWKDAGEKYEDFHEKYTRHFFGELREHCELSQKLHLDMKLRHEN